MSTNDQQLLRKLGETIRTIRKAKNIRQTHLAELTKMEKASLSRIEKGKANPTVLTLRRISKALGVSLAEFFAH